MMENLNLYNHNYQGGIIVGKSRRDWIILGKYILPNQQIRHNQHSNRILHARLIPYYQLEQENNWNSSLRLMDLNINHIIYECILIDPYKIMHNSRYYSMFLSVLNICDEDHLTKLLREMGKNPIQLILASRDHYAAQIIKKLIHVARKLPIIGWFPSAFAAAIVELMNHKIARDVVQTCFLKLDKSKNQPLYEEVVRNCLAIATDVNGCIALENCFDYMDFSPKLLSSGYNSKYHRERLLNTIVVNAALLAQHPYGNFVLQHVVPRCAQSHLDEITKGLEHLYEILSTTKSGSYLVEKLLNTSFRSHVVTNLLESDRLYVIAIDEYGNYVVQKLLQVTKVHNTDLYQILCEKLSKDVFALEHSMFGKNVAKLIREAYREQTF